MIVTPNGSQTAKTLAQVLRLMTEGLMAETFAEFEARGERITEAQFEVLRFIDRHERPTIGDVAEALHISSAAATKAVSGLVERAVPLVQRTRGADRRTVLLETTLAGSRLVTAVRATFTGKLDGILDRLGPAAQEQLTTSLAALLTAALVRPADCDAACLRCGVDHHDGCVVSRAERALAAGQQVGGG